MITYTGVANTDTSHLYKFRGLSTDTKPTIEDYPEMSNGSSFFEIDTFDIYFYDKENGDWLTGSIN